MKRTLLLTLLLLCILLHGCSTQKVQTKETVGFVHFQIHSPTEYSWERPASEVHPLIDAILELPLSENDDCPESPTVLRLEHGETTILFDDQLSFINVAENDVYRGCVPDAEQAAALFPLIQGQMDGIFIEREGSRTFLSNQVSGDLITMLEQHEAKADDNPQTGGSPNFLFYGLNTYHLTDPVSNYVYAYRNGQNVSFFLSDEELALIEQHYRTEADETESPS